MMKRVLQEPLLHFLLLGAALFIVFRLLPNPDGQRPLGQITITQGQLASMVEGFSKSRQRPPSREELQELIQARVREEVYYHEALALGLDKDDLIIRRRLAQKMQFISDDRAAGLQPTDVDLNAYLQAHPDRFRVAPQLTFHQAYLDPQKHGAHLARDAAQLLAQLNRAGGDAGSAAVGDPFMLGGSFNALSGSEIARQFGDAFAAKLVELKPNHWQGPVESSFGLHLVYISERTQGHLPALAEVRDAVRREWEEAQRLDANEAFYRDLLRHYTVTIEGLEPSAAEKKMAEAK